MNTELLLLKLLLYNNNYSKYNYLIDYNYIKEYNIELYYIYNTLKELYELTNNPTLNDLEVYFFSKYTTNKDRYSLLFDSLKEIEVSEEVIETVLQDLVKKKYALTLSEKALAYTQGRASLEDITANYDALYKDVKPLVEEDEFISTDIEELANSVVLTNGLRWRLQCLNKSLGSLRKGDFGAIFARPETGKTTFLADQISYMLDQTEQPLLWFKSRPV